MTDHGLIPPDPGEALLDLGRALSEIDSHEARAAFERELGRVGPVGDLCLIEVWRLCDTTSRAERLAAWSDGSVAPSSSDHTTINRSERLGEALMRGRGTAVVPRSWAEDPSEVVTWGAESGNVIMSIVDREDGNGVDDGETTVLIAVPTSAASLTFSASFVSDMAVMFKQFNRRIRSQVRLEHLLEVERAIGTASVMLGRADAAAHDAATMEEALELVRRALGARALAIVDRTGPVEIELQVLAAPRMALETPLTVVMPDEIGVDIPALLDRRFSERWSGRSNNLAHQLLTPAAPADFGELNDERSLLVVPAGTEGHHLLVAIREVDRPWSSAEIEAVTSFAVVVGQFGARARTEAALGEHRATDEFFAWASVLLADARPGDLDANGSQVLERMAEMFGLGGLALFEIDEHAELFLLVAHCEVADGRYLPVPELLTFDERPGYDAARESETIQVLPAHEPVEGIPPRVIVPVGAKGKVDHLLVAAGDAAVAPDEGLVRALDGLARLLTHTAARLEAERSADMAFEQSPSGIVIFDDDARITSVNAAALALVGLADDREVIGRRLDDVVGIDRDTVDWTDQDGLYVARVPLGRDDGTSWTAQLELRSIQGSYPLRWLLHAVDITTHHHLEAQVRWAESTDVLTGLANRQSFLRQIDDAIAAGEEPALLLFDLDRFQNVNESLGHTVGDQMLLATADRLRLTVRPGDRVARLGGDEFAVLLHPPTGLSDAVAVAERILAFLSEPFRSSDERVYPSASVGIAIAAEGDAAALLRQADVALHRAKGTGPGNLAVFDEELQRALEARHRIEVGLRAALANDEIVVAYQPEIDLITGEVVGAEALARWQHPDDGLLSAATFVPVAEETGLIHDVGGRVLDLACAEATSWPGQAKVRVNLSAEQLHRDDVVASVTRSLARHGLAADRLCLEITESVAMRDVDRSERVLRELRDAGVELAIDDFGTGYSSMAYLKRFPFQTLKIDQAFVRDLEHDPEDVAFVGSIISLADALGLAVVAEGIENQAQAEALKALGCRRGQGYLYAPPGPAEALRARLT
ncbi:MAG: bifunctional diguanylate cyclase/phosphodiesterase [Actinomycetota bacterium]